MAKQRKDKRKRARVSLHKSKTTVLSQGGGLFAFLKGEPKASPVINIGLKGLRLLSPRKLEKGDKLSFTITIPLLGAVPLFAEGEAIWTKPFAHFSAYLVGVKFTSMPPGSKKRLQHLIAFLGNRTKPAAKGKKIALVKPQDLHPDCKICHFAPKKPGNVYNYPLWHVGPTL